MRRSLALFAVVIVGAWAVIRHLSDEAQAQPMSHMMSSDIVRSVAIGGGRDLPFAQLRTVMVNQHVGERLDERRLATDRDAIANELAHDGYLAAKVSQPSVTYTTDGAYV